MPKCAGCNTDKPADEFHQFRHSARVRQITSRCKECRSEVYYRDRYPTQTCGLCRKHRPLNNDGICNGCHDALGIRECRGKCGEILPVLLCFYAGRSRVCKKCRKLAAKPE